MTTAFHRPKPLTRLACVGAVTGLAAALTFGVALPAQAAAPIGQPDAYAVVQDTPLTVGAAAGVWSNDADPDGDAIDFHSIQAPAGGSLPGEEFNTLAGGGAFTYYPPSGFTGTRVWTYRLNDAADVSDWITVTFTITAPPAPAGNQAPIGAVDTYTVAQDGYLHIPGPGLLANDSDPDGDPLTLAGQGYDVIGPLGEGLTTWPDGSLSYVAAPGFTGTRTWWYLVSDGQTTTKTSIVFNVTPAPAGNLAPVAGGDTYAMMPGTLAHGAVGGLLANDSDADGDALVFAQIQPMGGGALSGESLSVNADGSFLYKSPTGFLGSRFWRYKLSDGWVESDWAIVQFDIAPAPNTAPVAIPDAFDVVTNTEFVGGAPGVLGNDWDFDGDAVEVDWIGQPAGGLLTGEQLTLDADGALTYQPPIGFTGTRTWSYRISDGTDDSAVAAITFTIATPPNTAPVAVADAFDVAQDTDLVVGAPGVLVNDTDADGNALQTSWTGEPVGGVLPGEKWTLAADGSFVYTPPTGYTGTRTWMYSVHDSLATSTFVPVTFTVVAPFIPTLPTDPGTPSTTTTGGGDGGSLASTGMDGAGVAGTAGLAGLLVAGGMLARRFTRREA